jgi:hypothetical protein
LAVVGGEHAEIADVDLAVVVEVALGPDGVGGYAVVGGEGAEVADIDVLVEVRIAAEREADFGLTVAADAPGSPFNGLPTAALGAL